MLGVGGHPLTMEAFVGCGLPRRGAVFVVSLPPFQVGADSPYLAARFRSDNVRMVRAGSKQSCASIKGQFIYEGNRRGAIFTVVLPSFDR